MKNSEKHWWDNTKIYSYIMLTLPYIWTLKKSIRWKLINFKPEISPAIYAIWHGSQYGFLGIKGKSGKNLNFLISQSNDGEFIAKIIEILGYSTIRGSHKRGGAQALRNMLNVFEKGQNVAYTVDGPKGPRHVVKEGIIKIAQMAKVPIIPMSPAANWYYAAKSWDKYELPCPFKRAALCFGDPICIPEDASKEDQEKYRIELENKLIELHHTAKKNC